MDCYSLHIALWIVAVASTAALAVVSVVTLRDKSTLGNDSYRPTACCRIRGRSSEWPLLFC